MSATTSGIRRQLREANVPAGGLKYELYLRLRSNGLRIYNDARADPESESSDESDSEEEEDSESDEDSNEEDTSENEFEEPPPAVRSGRKRRRTNDEEDIEEGDEEETEEPKVPKPTSLADMPAELSMNILKNLDAGGTFNLVIASPRQFLTGKVNAFMLEAESRRNAANRKGLSLLEWVVLRVGREADFRANHHDFIQCVVDAYLLTYLSDSPQDRSPEPRVEEILVYLRQVGTSPVLGSAVRKGEADIVQLLILLGEDVNHRVNNLQPLEEATVLISGSLAHMNRCLIVFALLAGGADTTSTRDDYPVATPAGAKVSLRGVAASAEDRRLRIAEHPAWTPSDHPTKWPVIHNPRDLTVREFLADERSPFMDKFNMAMALIITRTTRYPNFDGYDPRAPHISETE